MFMFSGQRPLATHLWLSKLGSLVSVSIRKDTHHGEPQGISVGEAYYEIELGDLGAWLYSGLSATRK